MLPYAQSNWHTHLNETLENLDDVGIADKKEVGKLLLQMLRDEAVLPIWIAEMPPTFYISENLKLIRRWLEYSNVADGLGDEDRQWIESTKSNPGESYLPSAKVLASEWLQNGLWDPKSCMLFIHNILNLVRGRVDDANPSSDEVLPISVILDMAEWPGFSKTALWHRRLAMCLRDCKYYDEATEHFQVALDMDPEMWRARSGIAKIYAAQKNYEKAIELEKVNDSIMEGLLAGQPKPKEEDSNCCTIVDRGISNTDIADYYKAMGDPENAFKHYKTAFEFQNQEYQLAFNCIDILVDKKKNSLEIINLLKGMNDVIPGEAGTRLTAIIWEYFWWDEPFFINCSAAAEKSEELHWMIEVYETAAAAARKHRHPLKATTLDICISKLYQAADYEKAKVVRLWERVLKLPSYPGDMENWHVDYCKSYVTVQYSVYCLDKARESKGGTEIEWIKKLERLCKAKKKATDDAPEVITTNSSALYLGLWYRENGYSEEANACFQPFIKEALMILSDDDPSNDSSGFYVLAHALIAAGDDESAIACFPNLMPVRVEKDYQDRKGATAQVNESTVDEENINTKGAGALEGEIKEFYTANMEAEKDDRDEAAAEASTTSDGASHDEFPFSELMRRMQKKYPTDRYRWPWYCDGPCHRRFPIYAEVNLCRMCLKDICDDCMKLIKSGDHRMKWTCNPQHAWLHIDPSEQELVEGQILLGGKMISFEEFKERLRVEWKV